MSKYKYEIPISGFDIKAGNGVTVYPACETKRILKTEEYGFDSSFVFVFNGEGRLIEAGSDLYVKSSAAKGSAQLSVNVPAHGFAVASSKEVTKLGELYTDAMEGNVLWNATMSVIIDAYGSFDKEAKRLSISWETKERPADAVKILFVGNSGTYFNGGPLKLQGLCNAEGLSVDVEECTFGAAYLYQFADPEHDYGKALRNALKNKKYDYVVLQDASKTDYSITEPAVAAILPLIAENGAEPVLYVRYSSARDCASRIEGTKLHYDNYIGISEKYNIKAAMVGPAFLYCMENYPEINLYADDNSHHSKEGSYILACSMLYTIMGVDPVGAKYIADLDPDVANKLQLCAKYAEEHEFT